MAVAIWTLLSIAGMPVTGAKWAFPILIFAVLYSFKQEMGVFGILFR